MTRAELAKAQWERQSPEEKARAVARLATAARNRPIRKFKPVDPNKKKKNFSPEARVIMGQRMREARSKYWDNLPPEQAAAIRKRAGASGAAAVKRYKALSQSNPMSLPSHSHTPASAAPAEIVPITNGTNGHRQRQNQHNIRWTVSEMKLVAAETATILRSHAIMHVPEPGDRIGNGFLLDSIRLAQGRALTDKSRRRPYTASRGAFKEIFWELLGHAMSAPNGNGPHPIPAQAPATTDRTASIGGTVAAPAPVPPKAGLGAFEAAINAAIDEKIAPVSELMLEEMEKLSKEVRDLREELNRAKAGMTTGYVAPVKVNRPKVAIMGGLPAQFREIEQDAIKAGLNLELKHHETGKAVGPVASEFVILWAFTSHDHRNACTAAGIPPENMAFIRGGKASIIRQLEDWFKTT